MFKVILIKDNGVDQFMIHQGISKKVYLSRWIPCLENHPVVKTGIFPEGFPNFVSEYPKGRERCVTTNRVGEKSEWDCFLQVFKADSF